MRDALFSVYVVGALTGAPAAFINFLTSFVNALDYKVVVNRFFGVYDGDEKPNLYTFNRDQILKSKALVVLCDERSTGVGMEIMTAHEEGKKIVFIHHKNAKPAQMLLDFAQLFNYPVLQHSSQEPITDIVNRVLSEIKK